MKKQIYVTALLLFSGLLMSCEESDQWLPGNIPEKGETKTYSNKQSAPIGGNTLMLTYSGQELIGKDVAFTLGNDGKATLTLKGVLPGEPETAVTGVTLTQADGGYAFSGSTTGKVGTTFAFSGKIAEKQLSLSLTDVKIPANSLMDSPLLYLVKTARNTTDSTKKVDVPGSRVQKTITWQYLHTPTNMEVKMKSGGISLLAIMAGPIGKLLNTVLQGVTFNPDGNVTASYAPIPDTLDVMKYMMGSLYDILERPQDDWQNSPINLATYYMVDDTTMYLYPNVDMIVRQIGLDQAKTKAGVMDGLMAIEKVYKLINRWTTKGIKLIVKRIEENQYTLTSSSKYRETHSRYEGNYYLVLPPEETGPIFGLLDVLPDILPKSILDISVGNLPIIGEKTVGELLPLLQGVDKFQFELYFSKQIAE